MKDSMTKEEMFDFMNKTMSMHLATVEGDQPHVRGMLLYKADENGIIFHTGSTKAVYEQITANPKAELCFNADGIQLRVKGVLELDEDPALQKEIFEHPTRKFLHLPKWKENSIETILRVYRMKHCEANFWTMEKNFDKTEWIKLTE